MTAIFHELIEDSMEVFMDDFSVFGSSFDHCLKNLEKMLKRCEETNLVLNWEKCHFMVKEGIVLEHKVSGSRIEVDKAKIKEISKLPYPMNIKAIQSFLRHVGFYRRFIKDLSQIARPMTQLLVKDAPFNFSKECIQAFDTLKHELTHGPIMIKPDWSFPFEIMCDTSDYAVRAILGQRIDKHFKPIHYASKTMNGAQENYTTTEKELLAVVFVFNKFHQVLVLSKTIVFTDHSAMRYLFTKQDAKACMLTESYEGAWPEMRQHKFFNNVTTHHLKDIMASPTLNNRKDWSYKIDDALWEFWTAFKTPLGTTPFRIIYGTTCHLLVEIEHKAYWAIKNYNLDLMKAKENHFLQLNEVDKMRLDAYENSISYKERTKRWHDKRIKAAINYEKDDKVLLFDSA
uniref:DNA-directed DNA polymerase n=1 Tax=Tanacetum cinerariifolium TaxID=118510 RepID=A0A6L2LGR0_TANCI|nr:DNA-directed DNA polymerase [Tanacetum cinerariifolium]